MRQINLEDVRALTPGCEHVVHLNNCGCSLPPTSVLDAVREHLELEARVGGYEAADSEMNRIEAIYTSIARLIGTVPHTIALVENATVALSQALSCIPFDPGDVILTTREDYNSNQFMYIALGKRLGVQTVRAPSKPEGGVDLHATRELIDQHKPRLVSVTHVPTNSGLVQPINEIGAMCRDAESLYLVDACQSVGQMSVDVNEIGCDFLCATGRKFLRGPRGTGFLYVSERVLNTGLEPLFIDMRGATWTVPDQYKPVSSARRFENWESAWALYLGLAAAADYALEIGIDLIECRVRSLAALLRSRLTDLGLRTLDRGDDPCAIVTCAVPGRGPDEIVAALRAQGINTTASLLEYGLLDFTDKGVEWALRMSPHYYNTEAEIEQACDALATTI